MRCGRWVSKQTEGDLLHCTNWLRCRGSCELCENERKQWLPGSPWCSAHDSSLIIAIVCERFAHVFPFRYYFCQSGTSSLTMPNTFHRLNLLVQKTFNLIINSHEKNFSVGFSASLIASSVGSGMKRWFHGCLDGIDILRSAMNKFRILIKILQIAAFAVTFSQLKEIIEFCC